MNKYALLILPALTSLGCASDSDGDDVAATEDTGAVDGGTAQGTDADDSSGGVAEIDVDGIMEEAAAYQSYVQINAMPKSSQHALGDTVNVWVGQDIAEAYGSIDPEAGASDVVFPPGSYLFKEHLSGTGEFNGLTIMFKGPAGYDPEHGDWWWGRTTAGGTLADQGMVGFCINCHTGTAASDFVFGVPTDNRM